eukprot:CAMPEP_0184479432 /NCGR_PEP_ID=MMETSP0113_2-20130426/1162_1 /TAXON_ID=91329 /ORGANISM="Norrisiella sphaerica, Strain BC52" /LENGTH=170 /DNA_ID=CAMNT_0026857517 /DNA_START=26 /DNA_END=538 /DNA_ORIENTATION=+
MRVLLGPVRRIRCLSVPPSSTTSLAVAARSFSKESSKKKKKKQRNAVDERVSHPEFTQACIDALKETSKEDMWFEDRDPVQVAKDTEYYKEIQRRQIREARRVNKQLSRKIRAKQAAFNALPENMKKACSVIDRQPFPYEIGPWVESPPIEGYDPTRFVQNSGGSGARNI